jgi:phage terminase large subunit-like protein
MWCVGLGVDRNYYVVDLLRDRLNLSERTNKLMEWIGLYQPLGIGYERYGMQADIQHIEYVMETTNFRYHGKLIELGGSTKKSDRIGALEPIIRQNRLYLPEYCWYVNYEGRRLDMVKVFIDEEFNTWPVPKHDDMLDALQRILHPDLNAQFPPAAPIEASMTMAERDSMIVRGLFERTTTHIDDGFEGIEEI